MKKLTAVVFLSGVTFFGLSTAAGAAPNPNPNAPAHTGTACSSVVANNPNTGPAGHISATGAANFGAVGAAMCGLSD